jgi:hypothetical protein
MANFCIVAGIDLGVKEGQCVMRNVEIGARQRTHAGDLRVSVRAVKREAEVAVALLEPAAEAALRAACGNGMYAVTWAGDIVGTPVQANVEFLDMGYAGANATHYREPVLLIRER